METHVRLFFLHSLQKHFEDVRIMQGKETNLKKEVIQKDQRIRQQADTILSQRS